jgi:hypothetical protein
VGGGTSADETVLFCPRGFERFVFWNKWNTGFDVSMVYVFLACCLPHGKQLFIFETWCLLKPLMTHNKFSSSIWPDSGGEGKGISLSYVLFQTEEWSTYDVGCSKMPYVSQSSKSALEIARTYTRSQKFVKAH